MTVKVNSSRRRLQLTYLIWFLCALSTTTRTAGPAIVVAEEPMAESDSSSRTPDDAKDVRRPDRPGWVADPREFKVSLDRHGCVPPFNFVGQPWPDVLQWLATISDCSLDWQELPKDYLNLTTQQNYTIDEVRDLVNRHLSARGYTILKRDKVMSVFKMDALDPTLVPKVSEEELYSRARYDFVKVSFHLPDGVSSIEFAADVKQVLSPNAKVIPLVSSNCLLVLDTVANLRELTELLNAERAAQDQGFREFALDHARAGDVMAILFELLGIDAQETLSRNRLSEQQRERLQMLTQMQEGKADIRHLLQQGGAQDIHLALNRRRNSILANAPPEYMRIIERAIEAMDVSLEASGAGDDAALAAGEKFVKKYELKASAVETMLQTLNAVGGLEPGAEIRGDPSTKSLIVLADDADHAKVAKLIEQLDGAGRRFEVMPLRRLAADSVAVTVYHLMVGQEANEESGQQANNNQGNQQQQRAPGAGFRVDADVESNRLLLWANEMELEEVSRLLAKLGEVPAENSGQPMVRVLGPLDRTRPRKVLDQIKSAWSSFSDNELIFEDDAERRGANETRPLPSDKDENGDDQSAGNGEQTDADLQAMTDPPTLHRAIAIQAAARTRFADLHVAASSAGNDEPPVIVRVTEDGRVILNSPDAGALDAFEKLWKVYSPPVSRFRVFRLQHARAYPVWLNLKEYFAEELGVNDEPATDKTMDEKALLTIGQPATGLSHRRKLHIIYDTPSNSILAANASPAQLAEIQELIDEYDQPAPAKSIKARRTAAIKVHNSSAATIAAALKEVYRDLLSTRDKEFETEDAKLTGTASEAPTIIHYGVSDAESPVGKQTEPVKVRFDGSLSVGVDEAANMLIISAQDELFDSIVDTIHQLDEAVPRQTVAVHALRGNMSPIALSNAISAAFDTPVRVHRSQQESQPSSAEKQQSTVVQPKPKKTQRPKVEKVLPATNNGQAQGSRDSGGKRPAQGGPSNTKASEGGGGSAGSSNRR